MNKRLWNRCKMQRIVPLLIGFILLGGCSSSKDADFTEIKKMVATRLDGALIVPAEVEKIAQKLTTSLVEKPLTADAAVQIALLNNKALRAKYENLWIAKADYQQKGALSNPVVSGSVLFPNQSGGSKTEFSIEQNVMELFLVPLKGKANDAQFEKTKLEIAQNVLDLAFKVKVAYYAAVAARQTVLMRKTALEASEAALELTRRQFQAGNISELQLVNEEAMGYQIQQELADSELELKAATEKLHQLLGIRNTPLIWSKAEGLPKMAIVEPDLAVLEKIALDKRMGLIILKQELESQKQVRSFAGLSAMDPVKLGVKVDTEPEGNQFIGPTVEAPIPVFQSGQPAIAKQDALIRQIHYQIEDQKTAILSEVKLAYDRLLASRRKVIAIRDTEIPMRTKLIDLTQKQYNYMLTGVFTLLQAKQNEINARQRYIQTLREYWTARAELEQAVGGKWTIDPSKSAGASHE